MFVAGNSFSQSKSSDDVEYAMTMVNKVNGSHSTKTIADAPSVVDVKVIKAFDKYFLGASGLSWKIEGKNVCATFRKDEVLHCALFKNNGNLLWSIAFVPHQKLPADLMDMIKSQYAIQSMPESYAITFAADVNINNRNIWVVKLENEKEIVTLRSEDNNLDVYDIDKK